MSASRKTRSLAREDALRMQFIGSLKEAYVSLVRCDAALDTNPTSELSNVGTAIVADQNLPMGAIATAQDEEMSVEGTAIVTDQNLPIGAIATAQNEEVSTGESANVTDQILPMSAVATAQNEEVSTEGTEIAGETPISTVASEESVARAQKRTK